MVKVLKVQFIYDPDGDTDRDVDQDMKDIANSIGQHLAEQFRREIIVGEYCSNMLEIELELPSV